MINVCKLYYTLEKKNRGVKRINGEVFLVSVLVLRFVCVCVSELCPAGNSFSNEHHPTGQMAEPVV